MRIPPLGTVVALAIGVAAAAAAQCRMTYSISVYNDGAVSSDYSAVYGYSSSIDNSILCGCGHGGYQTTTTVYAPDGSSYPNTQGGMSSSVSVPVNGRLGTYQVTGRISLYCSCAGPVAAGGLAAFLYACPFPAGERSEAVSWYSGSDSIGARFMMDLKDAGDTNPPAGRYQGRVVSEQISNLVDGCWFPDSQGPILSPPSPSEWSSWTVTSINKYGGDLIANPTNRVRYYQQQVANGRYPNNQCIETDTQTMLMNGCSGGPGFTYDIHEIKIVVEKDKVTVFRGNGQATGNRRSEDMPRSKQEPLGKSGHVYKVSSISPGIAWIPALALLTGLPRAMAGWQQDVVFDSPRPLYELILNLEGRSGVPVTLEEPLFRTSRAESSRDGRGLSQYALERSMRLVIPARLLPDNSSGLSLPLLKQILTLYNDGGMDPVKFDAVSSEWGLHIVPVAVRLENGETLKTFSPLDLPVHVEVKKRMASEHLRALCEAVSLSAGSEVKLFVANLDGWFAAGGRVPPKHAVTLLSEKEREPYTFSWGVERGTGREALIDLLNGSSTTLGWTLFCRDNLGGKDHCFLGLHPLQVRELDEEGRPVLDEAGKPRLRYRWHDRLDKVPLKAPPIKIQ